TSAPTPSSTSTTPTASSALTSKTRPAPPAGSDQPLCGPAPSGAGPQACPWCVVGAAGTLTEGSTTGGDDHCAPQARKGSLPGPVALAGCTPPDSRSRNGGVEPGNAATERRSAIGPSPRVRAPAAARRLPDRASPRPPPL